MASCDARALHTGSYSAWLSKAKGDGARSKWLSSSNKRFFTIDFDSQLFYYSHSEDRKKISNPVKFKDIIKAEPLFPAQTYKKTNDFNYGFIVQTPGRTYELYTMTYLDAKYWSDGLMAGHVIATGFNGSSSSHTSSEAIAGNLKLPLTRSTSSLSTNADGSSDSGRSSDNPDSSSYGGYTADAAALAPPRGPQPRQLPVVRSGGYGTSVESAPMPPVYGTPAAPAPTQVLVPAQAPAPALAPPPELEAKIDPFAALDALEELAGPIPEQAAPLARFVPQNIQGALLREAHAMMTNKGAKPSAEATQALQCLRGAAPPVAPAPVAPALQQVAAPVAPAPMAAHAAPPMKQQPVVQQAMTYHNPSAESWDSDDDVSDSPKGCLIANMANPASAQVQLDTAPQAATPPRVTAAPTCGLVQPAPGSAPLWQAPVSQGPAVCGEACDWDSDDDAKVKEATATKVVAAPLHQQLATGVQQATEECGWDSDADAQAPKARAVTVGHNGARQQPAQAFVTAKSRPVAVVASSSKPGNDLDDLLGDVLTVESSEKAVGSIAASGLVPGFQCTACDFQVLRITGSVWGEGAEYMFFRNNYPNVQKLRSQLVPRKDCCSYCCQCSFRSAESAAELVDVSEGLRWRSIGC